MVLLAHAPHTTGDLDQARQHGQQALTLFTDLAVPDADDVHTLLVTLDQIGEHIADEREP